MRAQHDHFEVIMPTEPGPTRETVCVAVNAYQSAVTCLNKPLQKFFFFFFVQYGVFKFRNECPRP